MINALILTAQREHVPPQSVIIRHQQRPVILHQRLLQLVLRLSIHVPLIVDDNECSNDLTDGVDLPYLSSAKDANFSMPTFEDGFRAVGRDLEMGRKGADTGASEAEAFQIT